MNQNNIVSVNKNKHAKKDGVIIFYLFISFTYLFYLFILLILIFVYI